MDWSILGFRENPFKTDPIDMDTLDLFTGHEEKVKRSNFVFNDGNVNLVVEGSRGVGTTSFANYLRFNAQKKKNYLTPQVEIRIEKDWSLAGVLAAAVTNIARELEVFHKKEVEKKEVFIKAKALSQRISEAYNSVGISMFGIGVSYGQNNVVTQPSTVSSVALGHHLEDLATLAVDLGYKRGVLIQFNNLDVGVVHDEEYLKYIFNAIRDYLQIKNTSWVFVGDVGIRSFIARKVDRLDDIISHEEFIQPLSKKEFHMLIRKRTEYFAKRKDYIMPIEEDVFDYLYDITEGRLRYIFNLVLKLLGDIYFGGVVECISIDLAKPYIKQFVHERIKRHHLTETEKLVLRNLVKEGQGTASSISKRVNKNRVYVSTIMNKFLQYNLVNFRQKGNAREYIPALDAKIAYGE